MSSNPVPKLGEKIIMLLRRRKLDFPVSHDEDINRALHEIRWEITGSN
jgi:hypothetical protein